MLRALITTVPLYCRPGTAGVVRAATGMTTACERRFAEKKLAVGAALWLRNNAR
jgi:hypothetical protein